MSSQAAPLAPLTDEQRFELFREMLARFITLKPSHAPREDRATPSKLSPTYRAGAWAMDALKSAEVVWQKEIDWRSRPPESGAAQEGGSDAAY